MNILVTGGTGTISSGIVEQSVKQGHKTFAITRGNHNTRNIENVTYIKANVYDKDEIKKMLENIDIDIVVECLAYNCNQLKISLENFADKCKQYIFISTAGIFDRKNGKINENTEKNLVEWKYTKDKIECESYLKEFFKNKKSKYTIVRPVVTYGNYRIPYPIVSDRNYLWTLFERIERDCPILACNNVKFSIVHINDFSYAVVKLFNNEQAFNNDFNIAESNKEIYWDEVINVCGKILNKKVNIIHIPLEVFEKIYSKEMYEELKWNKSTELLIDDSKIKSVVNDFKCSVTLEDGMKSTISSAKKEYEENKILDMNWWYNCDSILFYAYKKNKLDLSDRKIVKQYLKTISLKDKLKMLWTYMKQKLRPIKTLIKKFLKKK